MTIELSSLNLFAGVGDPDSDGDGDFDSDDDATLTDAIGFALTSGSFGMAIIKANPESIAGDDRSFVAVTSSVDAELIGLPDVFEISTTEVAVQINRASGVVPLASPASAATPRSR